ncbi:MAG: biopolymer transporter ExbD [Dysgonamonadaceae bacterium]|nr:biopolymer transporter ExbD [Dysgonamonadaceae bacterium]
MSRFRKMRREVPFLNTTSLPDLIFTLLLFFMLVVNMRSVPALVQLQLPNTGELQKLKEKSLLIYIVVGKTGTLQINDGITTLEALPEELESIKSQINPEERSQIIVILKMDRNTHMGQVNDIRQILREQNLPTVYYAVEKSS